MRLPQCILSAGSNAQGQLGHGNLDDSHTFQSCLFYSSTSSEPQSDLPGDRVLSIKCGANHTVLLLERDQSNSHTVRELWGCGDGRKGQLGPAIWRDSSEPAKRGSVVFRRIDEDILVAASISPCDYIIADVACSWESTFIVCRPRLSDTFRARDILISMGNNDHGDLGVGLSPAELPYSEKPMPVFLENILGPCLGAVSGFRLINLSSGQHHVIATFHIFHESGETTTVIGWGACRHGQLGGNIQAYTTNKRQQKSPNVVSFLSRPRLLAPLDFASNLASPIGLGSQHTVVLHRSGSITGLGSNRKNQIMGLTTFSGITAVHCTWNGTYMYQEINGEWRIYSTGSNNKGQLGHKLERLDELSLAPVEFPFEPATYRFINMACGSEHVVTLLEKSQPEGELSEVWGWGWNEHGNLGLGHTADVHLPTRLWSPSKHGSAYGRVVAVSAGCGTTWIVLGE
ncbi:regulator of chromosome condensation 1/beta-lactamase-inhibitor protein II [Hysterangium stoloniferum]|nr:regulator of chromosome condensation 1/beta-lactamase-inhibitor protein II [Hysterangium stoloniferum]